VAIANTYRFFVEPDVVATDQVQLGGDLARQLSRVLRLRPGQRILLLDGQGMQYEVELTAIERDTAVGRILQRDPAGGEPAIALTLYLPLIRPERFEWALQKSVELGVATIVPVPFARSISAPRNDTRKLERWQRIVREAAEQACRGRLPTLVDPVDLPQACRQAAVADIAVVLWEGRAPALREHLRKHPHPKTIAVLSGPEGGITPEELTLAHEHGIIPVSLGARILRAETAPLAALAAIFYEFDLL
jgi:16S rRNA (uracil1498-N3)-methyltransferase